MEWYEILIVVIQALITIFVGWISNQQKRALNKYTLQHDFMLKLSKPYYENRIAANKEIYKSISMAVTRAIYFDMGVDEFNLRNYATIPGFRSHFKSYQELYESLIEYPFSELSDDLGEFSSQIHSNTQAFLDLFMEAYQILVREAKRFLTSTETSFNSSSIKVMSDLKTKILRTIQKLYENIDILNK